MIFYFSGTGNSKYVATVLAKELGERLVHIGEAMTEGLYSYELEPEENVGMVFPTYSWGPAPVVLAFMKRLSVKGGDESTYCYMVTTCGDDIGETVDIWKSSLPGNLRGSAAFSIQMPNNYIILPGFDTDPKSLEKEKIERSAQRIAKVKDMISARTETVDVVTGSWKRIKSRVIRPFFLRHLMSDRRFCVDEEACTSCGLCVRSCPVNNLTSGSDGIPVWNHHCAMCLSCIHRCPRRAIQYGKTTVKKGRYHFQG